MKRRVGRYVVFDAFAKGGMATVHLGRLVGGRGFSRLVAVKMLDRRGLGSSVHARALEEEARIASRIRHPNVVQPLDFVADGDDLFVVMEYVHGVSLSQLVRAAGAPLPPEIAAAVVGDTLLGLHAAHEATDEHGRPLGVIHRDVSPQNILVGADGVARLADFGIAKVMRSEDFTRSPIVKGKLPYMPPEQLRGMPLTRQADVFAAGAVLAEALSNVRPTKDTPDASWLAEAVEQISDRALREVVTTATRPDARGRYASAAEMGAALAAAATIARADVVAENVLLLAGDTLDRMSEFVRAIETEPIEPAPVEVPPDPPAPPVFVEPATAPAPRGRSWAPLVVLGVAIAATATVAVVVLGPDAPEPRSEAAPAASTAPAPAPAPLPASTASTPAGAVTEPAATHGRTRPGRPGVRPSAERSGRARPGPECDPPFRIDSEGHKHYKPECEG